MKQKENSRKDIIILLILLIILSFSIGIFADSNAANPQFSDTEVMRALSPQLISGDIQKVANVIRQLPFDQQIHVARGIVQNKKSPLNYAQKEDLIVKLVRTASKVQTDSLLAIFDIDTLLAQDPPLLYVAAQHNNEKSIPAIIQWLKKEKKETIIMRSVLYAVMQDNASAVQKMFENGVKLSAQQLREVLWQVIKTNKSPKFITILKDADADINTVYDRRTPLILAVENNNFPAVQELVRLKADVSIVPDIEIGSALQVAIRKGLEDKRFVPIELFLRKNSPSESL